MKPYLGRNYNSDRPISRGMISVHRVEEKRGDGRGVYLFSSVTFKAPDALSTLRGRKNRVKMKYRDIYHDRAV